MTPIDRLRNRVAHRVTNALFVATIAALLAITSYAQSVTGDVVGTAMDKNGALISGAHVMVRNTGTGSVRKTTTDERGEFRIASLPVAAYKLEIEAPGFVKSVSTFDLTVGQVLTLNP